MQKTLKTIAGIGVCLVTLALPTIAQEGPGQPTAAQTKYGTIAPNRPGFTNGSGTIAPGDALAENGAALTRYPQSQGGDYVGDLPETNLRFGVTPNLEADVVLPDYYDIHHKEHVLGDGAVGVKYKFYQSRNGNTKASVAPSVTIPTHTDYSSGQYEPSLLFGIQTTSGSRWTLASNLVFSNPTQSGSHDFTTTLSASVGYTLTSALSVYLDAYDAVPRTGGSAPVADAGFAYLVSSNVQLDAEYYQGLGENALVNSIAGGLSFRL